MHGRMDSSSAIRPDASTVFRTAATAQDLTDENVKAGSNAEPHEDSQELAQQLEGAETVIRQDLLGSLAGGSSRVEELSAVGGVNANEGHGSSRSATASGSDTDGRVPAPADGSGSGGSFRGPTQHTPASLTRELQGQRLNHFELLEQIGGGGMGAVFRAVDDRLGRTVAVKVVPFAAGDPDLQRRFRNEAQSAAKLDHPLIARVFEVGNDGPWYYIVFEYIDGRNIRDIVIQNGPLSLDDAVFYTCQVAEAIGHASRRGIVHRDIKPSNVVVTAESSIKLVDMGLARSESFDTSEDMTASGVTLGTFDYISPEQAHDPRLADIRSDLYSLGCTFFYMLTGSPPYPGGTMLQKLLNHGNAAIPDIREQREDASEDLAAILRKMLAKQPDQRYQNSQLLIADLRELAMRENLRRSRGVDVVTIESDNAFLRQVLGHLPWVVAASVLAISGIMLEAFSWQQRREFSTQVAATIPETALESVPVIAPTNAPEPNRGNQTNLPVSFQTNNNGAEASKQSSTANPPTMQELLGTATNSGADSANISDTSTPRETNPNVADAIAMAVPTVASRAETKPTSTDSVPVNPIAIPVVTSSANNPSSSVDPNGGTAAADLLPPAAASPVAVSDTLPSSDGQRTGVSRLPSDPPSMRNFPLPINSGGSDGFKDEMETSPRVPSFTGVDSTDNDVGVMQRESTPPTIDAMPDEDEDRSVVLDPPYMVRIVTPELMRDALAVEEAELEGMALATSLQEALNLAARHHVERIDVDVPVLMSGPIIIAEDDLVIASSVPGGTAIVFESTDEVDMQRSDMVTIGTNRVELVDLHLYWTVPASETDGGAMLALNENRQVRMTDCSVTIDNPSRRDEIHAFNIVTDPESSMRGASTTLRTSNGVADAMPLVSIELYNVIIRGQISMLRMDIAAELQLLWENGLLAVSRRMIETGGSIQRPQPKSGSIRLSLQRLTAYIPRGLLFMRLGVSTPYPVAIERRAEESVFVVDRGVPQVEISGLSREDRQQSWLRIRGASNAYEVDTTLNDPVLVVRDQTGQRTTTTMNDLIFSQPAWADDKTPRWVVRWSQPLPDSIAVSRLIPSDFRQDGSLFAGFREKSLPKLPMQRSFELPSE